MPPYHEAHNSQTSGPKHIHTTSNIGFWSPTFKCRPTTTVIKYLRKASNMKDGDQKKRRGKLYTEENLCREEKT